jgi:hypothetical protein
MLHDEVPSDRLSAAHRLSAGDDGRNGKASEKDVKESNAHRSNENKISDGWRGGAWSRVEGGIS